MTYFPDNVTVEEKYGPAMKIVDQQEADAWFEQCVEHTMRFDPACARAKAEQSVRDSLGYYAGYYGNDTRARVEHLFRCKHPFFGSIAEQGPPTTEEAFRMGIALGERSRQRRLRNVLC